MHKIVHRPEISGQSAKQNLAISFDMLHSPKQHRSPLMMVRTAVLSLILAIISLPIPAQAADPAVLTPPKPPSFVEYRPQTKQFQQALHPLVENINKAFAQGKQERAAALKGIVEEIDQAIASKGRGYHDELFHLRGYAMERLEKADEAQAAYQKSLNLKANNPVALFRLATILKEKKACGQAIPLYKEVMWRSAINHHEAFFSIGECHLLLDEEEKGLAAIERAVQLNPIFLPAIHFIVDYKTKLLEEEISPIKQAVLEAEIASQLTLVRELEPNDREAGFALARLLLRQSDPLLNATRLVEAEAIANQFADSSDYDDADAVRLLFDVRLKRGNLEQAESALQRGLQKNPQATRLLEAQRQLAIQQQALEIQKNELEEPS